MSKNTSLQLICDLIDGQLSPDEIVRAQQLIADDEEAAELYQSLREQQNALKSLPRFTLDDSFADRVVTQAQEQGLIGSSVETGVGAHNPSTAKNTAPAKSSQSPTSRMDWRGPVATLAALAATILAAMFIFPNMIGNGPFDVAQNEAADPSPENENETEYKLDFSENSGKTTESAPSNVKSITESVGGRDLNESDSGAAMRAAPQKSVSEDSVAKSALPRGGNTAAEEADEEIQPMDSPGRLRSGDGSVQKRKLSKGPETNALNELADKKQNVEFETTEGSSMDADVANVDSIKDSIADGNSLLEQSTERLGSGFSSPFARNQTGKVLFIELQQNAETVKRVNEVFAENGVEVELPLYDFDEMELEKGKGSIAEGMGLGDSQPEVLAGNREGFAFTVRTTPQKMQDTILKLGTVAQIRGVNLNQPSPANTEGAEQRQQQAGKAIDGFDSMQRIEIADLGGSDHQRRFRDDSLDKNGIGAQGSGVAGGGFGGGGGFSGDDDLKNESEWPEPDARIADVNRFLGLDEAFGQKEPQKDTFALVFVFKELSSQSQPAEPSIQAQPMVDSPAAEKSVEDEDDN